jgi:hypothetical protein
MKGEGTGSKIGLEERVLTPKMEKARRWKGEKNLTQNEG